MTDKLLWVAKKDGTGWSSARTRDLVDVAFTLTRESSSKSQYAILEVRCSWGSEPSSRATRSIGRMYFVDSKRAKLLVNHSLGIIKNNTYATKSEAREALLDTLLRMSEDTRGPSFTAAAYTPYMVSWSQNKLIYKSNLTTVVATTIATTPLVDSDMAKMIEEVQEVVEPAFNPDLWYPGQPVPAGWIALGKKITRIGWPS